MDTIHKILISDSRDLSKIDDESIDLVVTSPPYPMIQMWDELFSNLSVDVKNALEEENGDLAFELMHLELDKVWEELFRVTKNGSFVCINIGDATRTIGKRFQLYSNHSRIVASFKKTGFDTLPVIIWRKQTNAPNKFMGSGMLPSGAYVTLEHEYILIFRKGNKRLFKEDSLKKRRMESSFFWEERNCWFSDLWDFKGIGQNLNYKDLRNRSAAYPFELAYRLINMYSLKNDVVLDPFLGTGTTSYASIACARNSIGIEIDNSFTQLFFKDLDTLLYFSNERLQNRIKAHKIFIQDYIIEKGETKYMNGPHGIPVVTRQEIGIILNEIQQIEQIDDHHVRVQYNKLGEIGTNMAYISSVQKKEGKIVQPSLFA